MDEIIDDVIVVNPQMNFTDFFKFMWDCRHHRHDCHMDFDYDYCIEYCAIVKDDDSTLCDKANCPLWVKGATK